MTAGIDVPLSTGWPDLRYTCSRGFWSPPGSHIHTTYHLRGLNDKKNEEGSIEGRDGGGGGERDASTNGSRVWEGRGLGT
jgi:hypothetical protein